MFSHSRLYEKRAKTSLLTLWHAFALTKRQIKTSYAFCLFSYDKP